MRGAWGEESEWEGVTNTCRGSEMNEEQVGGVWEGGGERKVGSVREGVREYMGRGREGVGRGREGVGRGREGVGSEEKESGREVK